MRLLRTATRTAVVAGTATRVHDRVAARQHGRWAEQTVAAPPYVPAGSAPARTTSAMIAELTELGRLRDTGVLTEAEFDVQKALVLRA